MSRKVLKKVQIILAFYGVFTISVSDIGAQTFDFLYFNTDYFQSIPTQTGNHNFDYTVFNHINNKQLLTHQPIQSFMLAGDYIVKQGENKIAFGAALVNKKLVSSPLVDNKFTATIAYHKTFRNYKFHIAMQPLIFYRSLDVGALLFPDQYDRDFGGFNPDVATQETLLPAKTRLGFNLSAGLAATRYFSRFYSSLSLSVKNVLPVQSMADNLAVPQYFQFIISAKTKYYLTSNQALTPTVILNHALPLSEIFIGSAISHSLGYNNFKLNSIWVGAFTAIRTSDYPNDFICNVGLQIRKLQLDFAYAFNLSGQSKKVGSFNTYEITIGLIGINQLIETYSVPCEIY